MNARLLILSYEFPPYIGGAGVYAHDLAIGLARTGNTVTVVTCIHGSNKTCSNVDSRLSGQLGVRILRFKAVNRLFFLQLAKCLNKHFGRDLRQHFDCIILADARAIRFRALRMHKSLVEHSIGVFHGTEIASFHSEVNWKSRFAGIKRRFRKTLQISPVNIAVSEFYRRQLVDAFPEAANKFATVHHGIDLTVFNLPDPERHSVVRNNYALTADDIFLFSASRLVEEKGQDKLLQAIKTLQPAFPQLKLVVAGDGPFRSQLEAAVKKLQLQNAVKFIGAIPREELSQIMKSSDVFVLPSRRHQETFGLVFIEANACGVPVLAGNIGGVGEAVEDGVSGLLCNPFDVEDIASKLRQLADNFVRKKLGRSAFERVNKKFSCEVMAENTLNVLHKFNLV